MSKLTAGSLFAGIGGFDLGLERTGGFEIKFQVEIDEYCRRVLAKHWPNVVRYRDIRNITTCHDAGQWAWKDEPNWSIERVDVLCGGFPCQDISNAGKREGIDGERSGLWSEFARLIRLVRPRYVLIENVAALLGRGMERVLGDIAACGYDAEWDVIPASAVGAPHRRERVWIVAYAGHWNEPKWARGSRRKNYEWGPERPEPSGVSENLANSDRERLGELGASHDNDRTESCRHDIVRRGPNVADSERLTIGTGLCASESAEQWRRRPSNGGSARAIPYASLQGLPESMHAGTQRTTESRIFTGPLPERNAWWATEPDVGRVAHGIPAELVRGGVDGYEMDGEETNSAIDSTDGGHGVSGVRSNGESGASSSELRGAGQIRNSLSTMPCEGGSEGRNATDETAEELQSVRQIIYADSQQEPRDMQPRVFIRDRATKRLEEMGADFWQEEPEIPRVAKGVENRVDQLKGLGNALVPQIVEWIGYRILAYERSLTGVSQ